MQFARRGNMNEPIQNPNSRNDPFPSYDQIVKIYLTNGELIELIADWNFGLGTFVFEYEAFMRDGTPQSSMRYQMQDTKKTKNQHLNLKFDAILALHLSKK